MAFDPTDLSPQERASYTRDLLWLLRNVDALTRARGREYAEEGRVIEMKPYDRGVRAVVLGSEAYVVNVERVSGHLSTSCTCPFSVRGVICKHVAAVAYALTAIERGAPLDDGAPLPRLVKELPDVPTRVLAPRLALYAQRAVPHPVEGWRRLRDWWRSSTTKQTSVFRHAIETQGDDILATIATLRAFDPPPSPAPDTVYGQLYDRLARKCVELARRGLVAEVPGPLDDRHPGFELRYTAATRRLVVRERVTPLLTTPLTLELQIPLENMNTLTIGAGSGSTLAELFVYRGLLLAMIARDNPAIVELEAELSRPAWSRLLDHLVPAAPAATPDQELHFSVTPVYGTTIQVRAHLRGMTKAGKPRWKRTGLDTLARGVPPAPEEVRRVARLVQSTPDARRGYVDLATSLGHEVLLALRACSGVLAYEPTAELDPAIAGLSIVAGDLSMSLDPDEDGLVRPHFWIGDVELTRERALLNHHAQAQITSMQSTSIWSAVVPPALERWFEAWLDQDSAIEFPPNALDEVAARVAPLVASGAARLPKAALGSELPLELEPALRVEWRPDGTAVLELLVSVHPSAPLVDAGGGPDLYTFRHEGARVFVERDRPREWEVIDQAQRALAAHATWEGAVGRTENVAETLALVELLRTASPVSRIEAKQGHAPTAIAWGDLDRSITVGREGAWFSVRGDLRLGDTSITLGEVLDAARLARSYVPTGDGSFVHIPDEVQAKLLALATAAELARSAPGEGAKIHDAFTEALVEAEKMFSRSSGFDVGAYAKSLSAVRKKKVTPVIEAGVLRPYQIEGTAWMLRLAAWAPGCILADDMGLGKTVQTASVLLARRKLGPALVVAPASVTSNWKAELARFVPSLRVKWLNEDRSLATAKLGPGDVVIVSYGLLARLELPEELEFATLVLDEAQFLKNALAQRSNVVRALKRKFTIALTGTPLENHLGDLWSLFDQVFPGLLGREGDFRERFRKAIETGEGGRKLEALSRLVAPFLLRRSRVDVLEELPPRVELTQLVELSPDEAKRYAALRRACELEFTKKDKKETVAQTKIKIFAALTRLRQLACDVSLVDDKWTAPSSKLSRLTELATTLAAEKNRVLVFSQFRELCVRAQTYLERAGLRVAFLAGDTPTLARQAIVDAFQRGEYDAFCISLMAGGTGLNLTKANYVIHLDPWWNPAVEEQATSRAHRMGQTESVTVVRLVSRGTLEEGILELHAKKRELAAAVLEGKSTAKSLSADELLALVRYGDAP